MKCARLWSSVMYSRSESCPFVIATDVNSNVKRILNELQPGSRISVQGLILNTGLCSEERHLNACVARIGSVSFKTLKTVCDLCRSLLSSQGLTFRGIVCQKQLAGCIHHTLGSRDSEAGLATSYGMDGQGVVVRVPVGARFSPLLRTSSGAYSASCQWVPGLLFPEVKWPGRGPIHSPSST
jgi:hypothetical protein